MQLTRHYNCSAQNGRHKIPFPAQKPFLQHVHPGGWELNNFQDGLKKYFTLSIGAFSMHKHVVPPPRVVTTN